MSESIGTEEVAMTVRAVLPKLRVGDVLHLTWDRDPAVNPKAFAEIYFSVTRVDLRGTYSVVDGKPSASQPSGEIVGILQRGRMVGGSLIRPGQILVFDPSILSKDAKKVEWKDPLVEADTTDNVAVRTRVWEAATARKT